MLVSRRLDDQRYDEIVAQAKSRLPWLCPVWTDHNAHDPGITILELMAWYKEMQQYQMDQLTPALQQKLLQLAGLHLQLARPAQCALEIPAGAPARLAQARLVTSQNTVFELAEPIPAVRPRLAQVLAQGRDSRFDLGALLAGGTAFQPFAFGAESDTALLLGFSSRPEQALRLWFQVHRPEGVERNPPDPQARSPRTLSWEMEGAGPVTPLQDDTWSLSWSGYVTLPAPEGWQPGEGGLWWLRVRQLEGGCEEQVRLEGLSAGRYQALQQETWAGSHLFSIAGAPGQTVRVASAQAVQSVVTAFVRDSLGWRPAGAVQINRSPGSLELTVDGSGAAADGEENLMVVCQDPQHAGGLQFDARGQPGETFALQLETQTVLAGQMELICLTLQQNGEVRPALWHWVEDLSGCGPRDRAFTYDPQRETITFGDGLHGAVPAAGRGAILAARLVLSRCGGGNIPADAFLSFQEDGVPVAHGAAWGGRWAESLAEGRARLIAGLNQTQKCICAADYERCACRTPGLRVAGAKALPDYDPDAPQRRRSARVSVVVLPAGEGRRPMADQRFLEAVDRQLDRSRSICIQTRALPARYVPFVVSGQLVAAQNAREETVRRALEEYFAPRAEQIGAAGRRSDLEAMLQKLPGIFQVERLELRGLDQQSYQTPGGDLQIPPDGLLALEQVELELRRP